MKDIFNPNSYTEKAMPFITALGDTINHFGCGDLESLSNNSRAYSNKLISKSEKLKATLINEQEELFAAVQEADAEYESVITTEYFNRGFYFGANLAKELFDNANV